MKRTKRSVWHERSLAGKRARPRSCPQWLWYRETPNRRSAIYGGPMHLTGWFGGRDREKPGKLIWWHCVRGVWMGTVHTREWIWWYTASVRNADGSLLSERCFNHRRDAKRWVEVEAVKRGER